MEEKCVLILSENLPAGVAANTAAVLGITLGQRRPDLVGSDVFDTDGGCHPGIVTIPVPILKASGETLAELRQKLQEPAFAELSVIDFSRLAAGCKTYAEYMAKMAETSGSALEYFGLAICGAKKPVNKLTGSLPLFR